MHTFAGRVKVVSHSSCRISAIFKYFCPRQPSSGTECLDFGPYVIPSLCAGSNGPEKIARLCRLNEAFAARLYACIMTCTIRLVSIISFGASHVTYRTFDKSSFKHECAAIQLGYDRPLKFCPFTYFCT